MDTKEVFWVVIDTTGTSANAMSRDFDNETLACYHAKDWQKALSGTGCTVNLYAAIQHKRGPYPEKQEWDTDHSTQREIALTKP